MEQRNFISPDMSILLDLVRGLAALVVLIGHARGMQLYTGPYPFSVLAQHQAVIVFFVLSGLVIAQSTMARRTTMREFAIARVARIVPVAWLAIAVSVILFAWTHQFGLLESMSAPFDRATFQTIVLPAFFLSESPVGAGQIWNPPYWSLVCEVFFYALFGAAVFLRGRQRVFALVLLSLLAGWRILVLMPIWLMGAALAFWGNRIRFSKVGSLMLFVLSCMAIYIIDRYTIHAPGLLMKWTGMSFDDLHFARYILTDLPMGLAVCLAFIGMRPLADILAPALRKAEGLIRGLAGMSFTLYLLHHPILLQIRAYSISMNDSPIAFVAMLAMVIGLCAIAAGLVEHRTPQIRNWLRQLWSEEPPKPSVA